MNYSNFLTKFWLLTAIASLAVAGIFSLPPVILRGSAFEGYFQDIQYVFDVALIIHVNLSVLVWLLAMAALVWTFIAVKKHQFSWSLAVMSFLSMIGIILMIASGFVENASPLKNNYIPVLDNPLFFQGLVCFGFGITMYALIAIVRGIFLSSVMKNPVPCPVCFLPSTLLRLIKSNQTEDEKQNPATLYLRIGAYSSALILFISIVCFILSFLQLPIENYLEDRLHYYELLFWGGGHILQFLYTQILMTAWFYLIISMGYKHSKAIKVTLITILLLNVICVIPIPFLKLLQYYDPAPNLEIFFYLFLHAESSEYYGQFTQHMRYYAGIAPSLAGLFTIMAAFCLTKEQKAEHRPVRYALIISVLLFLYGGFLGFLIIGYNATIPAHYHGSIVGTSIGMIALCYYLMPKVGLGEIKGKLATAQPLCYGIGQVLHVTGLAWMGGYGALRKDAASSADIDTVIGKIMFFSGGAIAIIGGMLFIIVTVIALIKKRSQST